MQQRWLLVIVLTVPIAGVLAPRGLAQTAPVTGLRDNTPNVHAFINARIVVSPGKVISKGTLVIRNGVIEAVGENVTPSADARVWNMDGLTLYSGLIDLASDYGLPKAAEQPSTPGEFGAPPPPPEKPKGAEHWNAKAKADYDASEEFQADPKAAEKLRSQGFALVLSTPQRALFRGQSALVSLGDGPAGDLVVKRRTAQHVTFDQQAGFFSGYPNSLMGVIAFIRQTFMDADWYRRAWDSYTKNPDQKRPEMSTALAALTDAVQGRQPVVFEASNDINFLRAAKIGKEFSLNYWIRGSGEEYRKIDAVKAAKVPVIVPVNFPDPPEVETPEEALNTSLEDLSYWDEAPENAGRLEKAGVPIALSATQLKDPAKFLEQARKAVDRGLNVDAALAALTTNPAKWLGVGSEYGSLERGRSANILVTDGDLFSEKTKVREVWIDGKQYEVKVPPANDARGTWDVVISSASAEPGTLSVKGDPDKLNGSFQWRGKDTKLATIMYSAGRLALTFSGDSVGQKGTVRMSGTVAEKEMFGVGDFTDGSSFTWKGSRSGPPKAEPDTSKPKKIEMASFPDVHPPGEFGRAKLPDQAENILVKGATIWTEGPQGKLANADMLVKRGKIVQIGTNLSAPKDAVVIDASGKHVSPGIIDCHSHTAASSINEGGQAVTCETRIEDVLDPDNIWIYRQIAGGTTVANVLHGSANPIGGQNAVVKWRWGAQTADELLFQGAPPGVKFALGENVKQSNFLPGGRLSGRYPQTRMGVEQLIRDRFKAALDYEREWKEWEQNKSKIPPHKDLELEALLEIVKGKRIIHSHCYRQDEILMLIRVAEEFGIKIATLQHVLEGYKVADVMARHGVGGSTFSDWWAYKIEAWDAIPGNGPLMHDQGAIVSYNSDNDQLATRLNWEAAKAVKFGLSEEEALKFVTANPAKQLRIDNRVGTLEVGKDADFVIWNGNPLSTYSKCEQTWIDGRKYFDLQEDQQMRDEIKKERAVLVQKIFAARKESPAPVSTGGPPRGPRRPGELERHSCIEELISQGGDQ